MHAFNSAAVHGRAARHGRDPHGRQLGQPNHGVLLCPFVNVHTDTVCLHALTHPQVRACVLQGPPRCEGELSLHGNCVALALERSKRLGEVGVCVCGCAWCI